MAKFRAATAADTEQAIQGMQSRISQNVELALGEIERGYNARLDELGADVSDVRSRVTALERAVAQQAAALEKAAAALEAPPVL